MLKTSYKSVFLTLLAVAFPMIAGAAPEPADIRQQQDIFQRQRDQQLRDQMQPESNVHLDGDAGMDADTKPLPDNAASEGHACFAIREVVLVGEHSSIFQFALKHALRQTHFQTGKCLDAAGINQIMTEAQNKIIGRGYTTTRILAAPQDLKSGKLELTVLPGYLKSIQIDRSDQKAMHLDRIAAFQNEFPTRSDNILNLRDLEQGVGEP